MTPGVARSISPISPPPCPTSRRGTGMRGHRMAKVPLKPHVPMASGDGPAARSITQRQPGRCGPSRVGCAKNHIRGGRCSRRTVTHHDTWYRQPSAGSSSRASDPVSVTVQTRPQSHCANIPADRQLRTIRRHKTKGEGPPGGRDILGRRDPGASFAHRLYFALSNRPRAFLRCPPFLR